MKSIKEKAEEYDRVVERISANESIVDVSGREQFEAGANYVLEQIENQLDEFHSFEDSLMVIRVIEQLKK